MAHKYQYVVICRSGCGIQPLEEEEYQRQFSRPNSLWTCPRCGENASWDDECLETNPVMMQVEEVEIPSVPCIILNPVELQSKLNRVRQAENLVLQLPGSHNGRNTWLLNYGVGPDAVSLRQQFPDYKWDDRTQSLQTIHS